MTIKICTLATDLVHLIDVPLKQAQVDYHLVDAKGFSIVYVAEEDIERAKAALDRFGTFTGGGLS